jgi:hypothetical protein
MAKGKRGSKNARMPQRQLPIFPAGVTKINQSIPVQKQDGQVVYIHGHLPTLLKDRLLKSLLLTKLLLKNTAVNNQLDRDVKPDYQRARRIHSDVYWSGPYCSSRWVIDGRPAGPRLRQGRRLNTEVAVGLLRSYCVSPAGIFGPEGFDRSGFAPNVPHRALNARPEPIAPPAGLIPIF